MKTIKITFFNPVETFGNNIASIIIIYFVTRKILNGEKALHFINIKPGKCNINLGFSVTIKTAALTSQTTIIVD